ncbi:NBS-LRR resistance protein, partial [Trifolium medium]|nr:NBS-LRR resistance protein [Trifolium medium]
GVLKALEPHSGLKSFGVKSYGGAHFPPWMRNTYILKGLVHIILYDCKNCKKLPPLDLKYIDDALYEPATEKAFTSLKKLTLCDLPNLEGVLEVEGVEMLPELLNLSISCVPKLALPSLPSVELLSATRNCW